MSREDDKGRCCGTCKYHTHESIDDGWLCTNADSEYVADWTDYYHSCIDWAEKD